MFSGPGQKAVRKNELVPVSYHTRRYVAVKFYNIILQLMSTSRENPNIMTELSNDEISVVIQGSYDVRGAETTFDGSIPITMCGNILSTAEHI